MSSIGLTNTYRSEYGSYKNMIQRCHNEKSHHWKWYGAKGRSVCDRWRESFANFIEDMGPKPSKEYSLDRIDNKGNYEPSNCRWTTVDVQLRNRGDFNIKLRHNGIEKCLQDWSNESGVPRIVLMGRIKSGMTLGQAMETPYIKRKSREPVFDKKTLIVYRSLNECAKKIGFKQITLWQMLKGRLVNTTSIEYLANVDYRTICKGVSMREVGVDRLFAIGFKFVPNVNPLLEKYVLKAADDVKIEVDAWANVYILRPRHKAITSMRDYSHFVQTIETFTNL